MSTIKPLYWTHKTLGHEVSKLGYDVKITRETVYYKYGTKLIEPIVDFTVELREKPGDKFPAFARSGGTLNSAWNTFRNLITKNHM